MNTTIAPTVRQKIEIPYNYSAGPAMTTFLRGLQQKVIYASVCSECGRRSVPPLGFCGRCWREIDDLVVVEQQGVVETFVGYCRDAPQTAAAGKSLAYALIRLQDCSTNLVHLVQWDDRIPIRIGTAVTPVWKSERTASILDIAYFQPA
jgi:uncharacterized protein